ncbi:unnamed protein product [Oppiella nova]|uniref:ABC transporter family G domain-containing protein n=1 Tax=Oppiella nova TaxID=334625 RepID=A0A7R9LQH9_9ACAR|nr:unnamed protein product [Oppiella nova]CAG2165983.1 unnamed protein product [Oppiella nova]
MSDIRDTRVDECSGGQQKRLSIAIELTQYVKPNLLCIDEPTTGLDSNAAENVMKCLKQLSESHGIAVITSIHQPNNDILMLFDQIYVLAKGGVCVYSGAPQELGHHLNKCGISCKSHQKPIDMLMKVTSNTIEDQTVRQLVKQTSRDTEWLDEKCENETKLSPNGIQFKAKTFIIKDIWYLMTRMMTNDYICKWKQLLAELMFFILFPILLATYKSGLYSLSLPTELSAKKLACTSFYDLLLNDDLLSWFMPKQ